MAGDRNGAAVETILAMAGTAVVAFVVGYVKGYRRGRRALYSEIANLTWRRPM